MQVLSLLAPVLTLVLIGFALRRSSFPGDDFWDPAEKLTYFVLFPALIVSTLSGVSLEALPWRTMALGLATSILLASCGLTLAMHALGAAREQRGGLIQGAIRMNTYVGIAICQGLYGEEGIAHAAVAIAIIVPLVNAISVSTLAWNSNKEGVQSLSGVVGSVLANPLILACLTGVTLNASGLSPPTVVVEPVRLLGRGALPLGLLVVGASISLEKVRSCGGWETTVTLAKLGVLPAIGYGLLRLLEVNGVAGEVSLVFLAIPTAPSAYLLTKQMGGDAAQMATLVTIQTLFSAVTLPIWLSVAN